MPNLDGSGATRRIRSRICPQLQPQIYATTANVLPADQEEFVQAGVDDFIAKPVLLPQLKAALAKVKPLSLTSSSLSLAVGSPHPGMAISSPTLVSPESAISSSGVSVMLSPYSSPESAGDQPPSPPCQLCCQLWHPDEAATTEE